MLFVRPISTKSMLPAAILAVCMLFSFFAGAKNAPHVNRFQFMASPDTGISPLPVRLESFEGSLVNPTKVLLKWVSAEQWSNIHYEIQRAADNYEFKTIGLMFPIDNQPINRSYAFPDKLNNIGNARVLFYRLKQVSADDKIAYSFIIAVKLRDGKKSPSKGWPNPFVSYIEVNVYTEAVSNISLRLVDSNGRMVKESNYRSAKGNNIFKLEGTESLGSGNYFLQTYKDGKLQHAEKMVKLFQ
jgi:Secretion system C-terminal sorting domain